jgi:hypothetical protein
MPPAAFDKDSADSLHCQEDYDSELSGIPNVIQGMALKSVAAKPSRQWSKLTRELGQNYMWIGITPELQYDLDGKDLLTDGIISNAPIGKPLTRAQVAVFSGNDNYGYSLATGYFFIMEETPTRNAGGEPRDNKVTLTYVFSPTASVNHVAAP